MSDAERRLQYEARVWITGGTLAANRQGRERQAHTSPQLAAQRPLTIPVNLTHVEVELPLGRPLDKETIPTQGEMHFIGPQC